uniref:Uncharacterized protein n=1 Tax=Tanacetum cinerariifolium TaxID=118510 RepID=A0A6L2KA79_TANCI|nr:hypothetical protein [Tanacetum cinerariifolium]
MGDPVICISDDSFEESVRTPLPMIISPDTVMPAVILPIVSASLDYVLTSPDYYPGFDTETGPSNNPSSEHVATLPATSPFLFTYCDSSESSRDLSDHIHHHLSYPSEHSSPSPLPRKRRRLQRCSPSESSDYVSPSPSTFVGPSRKRCRSLVTLVPSSAYTSGALSLACADLLPPEASTESDIDPDILADIEADAAAETATFAKDDAEAEAGDERDDEAEDDVESSARGTIEIEVNVIVKTMVPDDILVTTMDESARETFRIGLDVVIQELLLDRVRVLEGDNMRLQGTLSVERERESCQYSAPFGICAGYVEADLFISLLQ